MFTQEAIEYLVEKVREVKKEIGKIRELAFRHKFSLSFIQPFEEAFRYSVCHVLPAKLPLIACQACSTLLGCESCANLGTETDLIKNVPNAILHADCLNLSFWKVLINLVHQLELMNEGTLNSNDSNDTLPVFFQYYVFVLLITIFFRLFILHFLRKSLTLSRRRPLSYRNQSIDLLT